ncbi:MAG: squalene/phytoene synthase family protein [Rubripirellula sp.]
MEKHGVNTTAAVRKDQVSPLSDTEIDDLLERTSRTFALCIPMLPSALRRQVGVAYLLFRIADTIEDSTMVSRKQKLQLLGDYTATLDAADQALPRWPTLAKDLQSVSATSDEDDALLFSQTARVIASSCEFEPSVRGIILDHVGRSSTGMRRFVESGDSSGNIQLSTRSELGHYCYCVAGMVGEMLTDLFLKHDSQLESAQDILKTAAVGFGEALQLVNILKDCDSDQSEGRRFIPSDASWDSLIEQAQQRINIARQYIDTLRDHGAEQAVIRFTMLPVLLASSTLALLRTDGPGAKLGREEVAQLLLQLAASNEDERQVGEQGSLR